MEKSARLGIRLKPTEREALGELGRAYGLSSLSSAARLAIRQAVKELGSLDSSGNGQKKEVEGE